MASWRDSLRPASFRGAAFHIESADQAGGRRQAVHEFAQRDDVFVEDLGLSPNMLRLDGFVLGENYMAARDAVITACETAGVGTLVHPYRGALTVSCMEYTVREDISEGGMARFTFVFLRSAGPIKTTQTEDTGAGVAAAASAAADSAQAAFIDRFSVADMPAFVGESAAAKLVELGETLDGSLSRLQGARDTFAAAALKVTALRQSALTLVRKVPDLAGSVHGLIASVRLLAATPATALRELSALIGFGGSGVNPIAPTTARQAEAANTAALAFLVGSIAASEAAQAAAEIEFGSYNEAVAVRDQLADRIDAAAQVHADLADDEAYGVLTSLRLAVVRDITVRGGSLARLYDYTPPATTPALVVAYRLYADVGREAEIVARNSIVHPGFAPGGQALEVLTDG